MKASLKLSYPHIFFILLFHIVTAHSFAQSFTKRQVDSLFQVAHNLVDDEQAQSYSVIKTGYNAAKVLDDQQLINNFKILSAFYFSKNEQLDTAELLLKEVEAYFLTRERHRRSTMYGVWHLYYGYWLLKKKDFATSEARYVEALQFFRETDNRQYEALAQSHLGTLNFVQSNNTEALEHFIEAYQIKRSLDETSVSFVRDLLNIANIYHRMGLNEKTLEYGNASLKLARETGETNAEVNILLLMGAAYNKIGKNDSTFLLYDQAYNLARAKGLLLEAYYARYNAANTYSNLGNYELSNRLMKEIQRDSVFSKLDVAIWVRYLLSKNYLHTSHYDSSIYFATLAFEEAQVKNEVNFISLLADILAEAYEQKKDIENALVYSRIHHAIQDTLFNQAQQNKFNELHARLETIEQEKQKITIEKKTAHDKLIVRIWFFAAASIALVSGLTVFVVIGWYKNEEKKKKLKELQLKSEIDLGQSKLYKQTLHMIHVNNNLEQLEAELKKIKADMPEKSPGIDGIISTIHATKSLDKEWEKFDNYFARVHFSFYEGVLRKFPQLSSYEIRICSLLKLGLSNKEIATIMGIEQKSIRMAKYRLKKKLGLAEGENVDDFLLMAEKSLNNELL